jgi:hypothetical protein
MKQVKAKSGLLRSPYRLQPVNATARRVAGIDRKDSKNRLREQITQARRAAQAAVTPEERASALSLLAHLLRQLHHGEDPDIGPSAVRRAQRALERAKWMRK